MNNITNLLIPYKEVTSNIIKSDPFGIASLALSKERNETFENNPNLCDENTDALYLSLFDSLPIGRIMFFPELIKINDHIYLAESGSALEVHPDYRKYAIGADLMLYWVLKEKYDFIIAAGISDMALPMYKKLKFHIFEYPRLMMLRNTRCLLEAKGIKGFLLKNISFIANFFLKIFTWRGFASSKKLCKKYNIKKETIIPDWVDDVVLKDGHKYMEVHDKKWLQWNLDYNFRGLKRDTQSFYTVWENGKPLGFFMTKERFRELAGGTLKNVLIGSIVEWGAFDETILSEADLSTIALSTFSKDLDIIEMATNNEKTALLMKKMGFMKHGYAHIAVKDKFKKMEKDFGNPNLWRIRYGYGDVILT